MKDKAKPILFDCLNPGCGAALIPAVAQVMAEGLDANQIGVLGNFLSAVGDTLAYMSAQMQRNEQICPKNSPDNKTDGKKSDDDMKDKDKTNGKKTEDDKKSEDKPDGKKTDDGVKGEDKKDKNNNQYSRQWYKESPYRGDFS